MYSWACEQANIWNESWSRVIVLLDAAHWQQDTLDVLWPMLSPKQMWCIILNACELYAWAEVHVTLEEYNAGSHVEVESSLLYGNKTALVRSASLAHPSSFEAG